MSLEERTFAIVADQGRRERRAFQRWSVAVPAQCYGACGSSQAVITEISEAGLNLTWPRRANPGDELVVAWQLDEGPALQVTTVVRCSSQQSAGLEFLDAKLPDRLRILAFLKSTLKSR